MAYLTGSFNHPTHRVAIDVLQPTKDELSFSEGRKMQITWDDMHRYTSDELEEIAKWILEISAQIRKEFMKNGQKKLT